MRKIAVIRDAPNVHRIVYFDEDGKPLAIAEIRTFAGKLELEPPLAVEAMEKFIETQNKVIPVKDFNRGS